MAKASWLNTNPGSASGNGTVGMSSTVPNTGRSPRSTVATFSAAGTDDVPVSVLQAGRPEFVTIQSSTAVDKAGGTATVSGTSNSQKLNFTLGAGAIDLTLPDSYIANSATTENNTAIAGDPGDNGQYNFSIAVQVPANAGVTEVTRQLVVTDNAGQQATCLITLAGGDPILSVSPTTVNLDWEGNEVSVTVTSNTTWTVS